MFLPKALNQLILKFAESPRIPDLLRQLWMDQLAYGQQTPPSHEQYHVWTITKYQIQPTSPLGDDTFADGWQVSMEFRVIRRLYHTGRVDYAYEIKVIWVGGHDGNAIYEYHDEWDDDEGDMSNFPSNFTVLGTMPRVCKDVPPYFVGHVYGIEVDCSAHPGQETKDREHLYSGGSSFDADMMLAFVELDLSV